MIRLFNSSSNEINTSLTSTSPNDINFSGLSDGVYFFNATANDTLGNTASLPIRNVTIDTIFPDIEIVVPSVNQSNTTNTNQDINFTVSDLNLDSCWYSNDTFSINRSLVCGTNLTNITWSEGNHNITIYANDSANNKNRYSINF